MLNQKSSFVIALLLSLAIFASVTTGQTRRGSSSSRRARRTAGAKVEPKKSAARAVPLATTTPSGLTYMITQHGAGQQLKVGDTVRVHYTGLLGNGRTFDSSLDRNEPIEFPLGAGRVIKGWDEGIALLRVGDQATLVIPPQLGYGSRGAGGAIPPDATLIFIVEVVGVKEAPATGSISPTR
ncbi:MAG: peptidyl-prolyl cis-trans isomerase [Blastocatellia bacterium]|jgi:FKBP-type peptidyl-prolyl cis-trans isomerase|nr:peptidyl-prolyl cis-trans isomerase [Blastocatellia bacterium]